MREHRVGQFGRVEVDLDGRQRRDAAFRERLRIAEMALARAIGCGERAREHQHAAMAARGEQPHAVVCGVPVVDRHRRPALRVVVHQHVMRSVAIEHVEQRMRVGVGDGQDQAFDALLAQRLDRVTFARRVVFGGHQDQLEAGRSRKLVDAEQAVGEYGVRQRRHDDADEPRALAAQLPAERTRTKAQRIDCGADRFERRRTDGMRRIDRARHGGDRKAGECGDILDGRSHEVTRCKRFRRVDYRKRL
ncbi:hypothetical protein FEP16_01167 [Burkholderia multivorans]|nr:hypothetical protein [Burkholderia multivorans]